MTLAEILRRMGRYLFIALGALAALGTLVALNNNSHHIQVVAAKVVIARGATITADMLSPYDITGTAPPEGTIPWSEKASVENHINVELIYPNEPIRRERLLAANGKGFATRDADQITSPKNRLYCIPINKEKVQKQLPVAPGDYVDVIGTFSTLIAPPGKPSVQQSGTSAQNSIDAMVSQVIIQHAYVLQMHDNCAVVEVGADKLSDLAFLDNFGQLTMALDRADGTPNTPVPTTAKLFLARHGIPSQEPDADTTTSGAFSSQPFSGNGLTTPPANPNQGTINGK